MKFSNVKGTTSVPGVGNPRVSIMFYPELMARVNNLAESKDVSFATVVRTSCTAYLNALDKKKGDKE